MAGSHQSASPLPSYLGKVSPLAFNLQKTKKGLSTPLQPAEGTATDICKTVDSSWSMTTCNIMNRNDFAIINDETKMVNYFFYNLFLSFIVKKL